MGAQLLFVRLVDAVELTGVVFVNGAHDTAVMDAESILGVGGRWSWRSLRVIIAAWRRGLDRCWSWCLVFIRGQRGRYRTHAVDGSRSSGGGSGSVPFENVINVEMLLRHGENAEFCPGRNDARCS